MIDSSDRRANNRTSLDIVDFPFVGCRETDLALFEYSLADVSDSGVQASIRLRAGENAKPLGKDDTLHLLLFLRPEGDGNRLLDQGKVMWARKGTSPDETVCGLHLETSPEGRTGGGGHGIPRRLSLSLETSNMVFEDLAAVSAHAFLLAILEESVAIKEDMVKELGRASGSPCGQGDEGLTGVLRSLLASHQRDIALLRSYHETAVAGIEPRGEEGPLLGYGEICALLKGDAERLDFGLRAVPGGESTVLERVITFHKKLLANHNTLVLLRTGFLAYVYQNQEDSL